MAKLIEVKGQKVSEDTIVEALRKHVGFEEEKKFEPIAVCHLKVSASTNGINFNDAYTGKFLCGQCLKEAKRFIEAIQSAIDFLENK